MEDETDQAPESLLPYDEWTEAALRQVMVRAIQYVAERGLPGEHHFYITFRTDHPGCVLPPHLKMKYPQEMTIVLQHQFHGLAVDEEAGMMRVGLSFGGIPATLQIPLAAITGFADPYARHGMRFNNASPEGETPEPEPEEAPAVPPPPSETPQVVSLDAFRRRTPPKE